MADITKDSVQTYNVQDNFVSKQIEEIDWDEAQALPWFSTFYVKRNF